MGYAAFTPIGTRVVGIVGASGSGKTTLIERLVPLLKAKGLRVSTIKHAHHGFDMDRPGKDSYRHRAAGAEEVMVFAHGRWALLREDPTEPRLGELIRRMARVDIILVEGFKAENIPKIEVYRPGLGKAAFYPDDPGILAVATDAAGSDFGRPILDLNDPNTVAAAVFELAGLYANALSAATIAKGRGGL